MTPPPKYSSIYLHYIPVKCILSITFFIYLPHFSNIIFILLSAFLFTKNSAPVPSATIRHHFITHSNPRKKYTRNILQIFRVYYQILYSIMLYILIFFLQSLLQVAAAQRCRLAETENLLFPQIQNYLEMTVTLQPLSL